MRKITGRLYQQFAVTIAISVILSAFNALTLSPALAALMLRPKSSAKESHGPLRRFFNAFQTCIPIFMTVGIAWAILRSRPGRSAVSRLEKTSGSTRSKTAKASRSVATQPRWSSSLRPIACSDRKGRQLWSHSFGCIWTERGIGCCHRPSESQPKPNNRIWTPPVKSG